MKLSRYTAKNWNWQRTQTSDEAAWQTVQTVTAQVLERGDSAVRAYSAEFDGCTGALKEDWDLRVPEQRLRQAWESISPALQDALQAAMDRIRAFHQLQLPNDISMAGADGEQLGLTWRPLQRVGVYSPGGRAVYPSTVLMNVIPAQVAGVRDIALASPPSRETEYPHDMILAAAHLAGVTEVYRVGGAQAIAALAYGTDTIERVDKVVGPGNLYVALAKRAVMGEVGIDSIAGPSEVFIVADDAANPEYVAADMIAQAEHDPEAGAVCVTTSTYLAEQVELALERQLANLPRRSIAQTSLEQWGAIVIVDTLAQAMDIVNQSAPEHVELLVENPASWLPKVNRAGAVFLGPNTPEPVGDYYAGPNHVLPTFGSARYASGLGVGDFLRRMTYVEYTAETIRRHADHIVQLATSEGLDGHARSVQIRLTGGRLS